MLTVLGIGYSFARQMEVNPIFGAVISLVNWFLLMPYEVAGDEVTLAGIPLQWVGSQGVFLSIIVAIISVHIYTWVENKGWVIHMPEGVPPQVERSFSALIPSGVSLLVFFFINILFGITSYGNAFSFVYEILQIPLLALGNTLPAMVVAYLFLHFFWFFGINGGSVVGAVFNPILQTLSAENLSAYRAGEELPNIINQQFQDLFATFGGAGSTLSLLIAMFLFCKSKRITELGKLSILPGFFGINEPVVWFTDCFKSNDVNSICISSNINIIISYVVWQLDLGALY